MKAKSILFSVMLFNLIVGNLIISRFSLKFETIAGRISLYATFSTVAVLLILFLIWFFQQKSGRVVVIFSSILAAYLVPTISIYVLFVGYGLFQFELDSLIKGIPIAIISGIVSWFLWLPIGIINSIFFITYINKLKNDTIVS